jgi:hypothetical protein
MNRALNPVEQLARHTFLPEVTTRFEAPRAKPDYTWGTTWLPVWRLEAIYRGRYACIQWREGEGIQLYCGNAYPGRQVDGVERARVALLEILGVKT